MYRRLSHLRHPSGAKDTSEGKSGQNPIIQDTPSAAEPTALSNEPNSAHERLRYAVTHGHLRSAPYAAGLRQTFERTDQGSRVARWHLEAQLKDRMIQSYLQQAA